MRTWAALLVVALVVLAGCGSSSAVDSGDGVADITPASVPTDHPMDDRPPGVGRSGLSDPIALADAHAESLVKRNFTVRTRSVIRDSNGTALREVTRVARYDPPVTTETWSYGETTSSLGPSSGKTVERWANGSTGVVRLVGEQSVRYSASSTVGAPTLRDELYGTLPALRDGQTTLDGSAYRVETTEPPMLYGPYTGVLSAVESWNQTLVVEPDGRIRWLHIEFAGEASTPSGTVPVTGSYDVQFSGIGSTSVERPDWVSVALEATDQ
ncbi:hypothetical protein ACFPYI_15765 [Halomarina salina]|uniref:Lipoprotein n=1 Tax=Halomarina salina TaxID=1872699 RepID=A0ABD5RR38_9EURY|nr:hypothetical protein [Halomarina salina]